MGEGHPGRLESLPHKDAWPTKKESAPQGGLPHNRAYGTQAEMPGGIIRRAGAGGTEGNG